MKKKLCRAPKALVLWTLIALSLPLLVCSLSDSLCLSQMIAKAERQELDRHLRSLTAALADDAFLTAGLDEGILTHPDLLTMTTAGAAEGPVDRSFLAYRDGDPRGLSQAVAFTGTVWPAETDRRMAAFVSNLPVVVPAVADGGATFADFKRKSGVDAALFLTTGDKVWPVAATRVGEAWLSDADLRQAARGGAVMRERRFGDTDAVIMAGPIHDESGRRVGVAVIARDRAALLASVRATRNVLLGIGVLMLFVGVSVFCAVSSGEPARS